MDKWYLVNDRARYLILRTSVFSHCFWLFHSQGCLLLNSQSKPHCTFELPILMGRPCQREIWIHTDLRSDVRYHILCLPAFEARTLPRYNTHIIPTLTKLSCDEQLHWDWNYSTNIPAPGWLTKSPLHERVPLKTSVFRGVMWPHQGSEINLALIIQLIIVWELDLRLLIPSENDNQVSWHFILNWGASLLLFSLDYIHMKSSDSGFCVSYILI